MANESYKIIRGRTTIAVPHLGGELVVGHPFYGPDNALNLQRKIRADRLREASFGEAVSFLEQVFCSGKSEPEFEEAKGIMKGRYARGFTGILYDPTEEVAYFADLPKFNESSVVVMDKGELVARVKRGDKSVRTLKFNQIKDGEKTPSQIAKDAYFIALAGSEEGAEKTARIAEAHPAKKGYLWLPQLSGDKPIVRTAGLDSDGGRLVVCGDYFGDYTGSFAFGVLDSAEGSAPKK
jgi:hypothetical protein